MPLNFNLMHPSLECPSQPVWVQSYPISDLTGVVTHWEDDRLLYIRARLMVMTVNMDVIVMMKDAVQNFAVDVVLLLSKDITEDDGDPEILTTMGVMTVVGADVVSMSDDPSVYVSTIAF